MSNDPIKQWCAVELSANHRVSIPHGTAAGEKIECANGHEHVVARCPMRGCGSGWIALPAPLELHAVYTHEHCGRRVRVKEEQDGVPVLELLAVKS